MRYAYRTGLTGSLIERADQIRISDEAVAEQCRSLRARLLKLADLDPELGPDGLLCWGSMADRPDGAELLFLGLDGDAPCFAPLIEEGQTPGMQAYAVWRQLDMMPPEEASTYAAARSLIEWHRGHLFCSRCGTRSRVTKAGWGRKCPACDAEHFPRVDPVVIMLAEYEGKALVGRQPRFPPDRYSALAGFVEPGEAIEEAVARELFEEAGVRAKEVRYLASQPWPFPNSLMMACIAPVEDDALTLDIEELEAAMWVSKEEVAASLAGAPDAPFIAPPHFAIAHTLLRAWVESDADKA
ncbi:NAD(+) diphosphatase [Parasphingopyxis marina]|uniref:NAD(+) diphosphatase n=1 Tax=Parasphingopyxis marina TaxID=2761622 RepID=A0A842I1V3_9SPHN|nr:NAD(+) diphosphatase [Parasphingopyxis marina]MBC2778693.1 NAD(+) diphosphatase [Parasphingopyxis marina]